MVSDPRQRTSRRAVAKLVWWAHHHQCRAGRGAARRSAARSSRAPWGADENTRPGIAAAGSPPSPRKALRKGKKQEHRMMQQQEVMRQTQDVKSVDATLPARLMAFGLCRVHLEAQ